ncbi:MAG: nuclear transport factor 2 family protein [Coxiellaceae bacterium]|nr:nuclear transport factor 2 family protein [Coxiellaceae bacterium]
MPDNNLSTVLSYYDAINHNDPNLAAEKLADDIQIISPLATKTGKTDVVEALKNICSIVERVTIKNTLSSEDQVMFYDPQAVISKKDEIFSSEEASKKCMH